MRRHGLKKGLSLLLVFCMILSLLPMTALADEISEPGAAVEEQESAGKDETTNAPDDTTGDKQDDTGEAGSEAGTDEAGSETGTGETGEAGTGETGSEAGTGETGSETGTGETGSEAGTGETGEGEEEKNFVDKVIDEIKDILTPITGEKTEEEKAAEEAAKKAEEEEAAKKAEEEAAQKAAEEAARLAEEEAAKKAAEEAAKEAALKEAAEAAQKAAEEAARKAAEEEAAQWALAKANAVEIPPITMGTKPEDGETKGQPFSKGTGGSANFRIPALVTLSNGGLVAAADARWNGTSDGYGLDTIVSRSSDNGETWNYTFANYLGDNGNVLNNTSTAFIDPALAVDGSTVYMLVDLYPAGTYIGTVQEGTGFDNAGNLLLKERGKNGFNYYLEGGKIYSVEGNVEQRGYSVDDYFNLTDPNGATSNLFFSNSPFQVLSTSYLYLTKSTDGGKTWSAPQMLNPDVKDDSDRFYGVGPGRGLVTSTGRIMFACYPYTNQDGHTSVIYSDNNGRTWRRSDDMTSQSSEAALVEADGRIYMFTRHGGYYVSEDNGETWSDKKSVGITYDTGCQISAITYSCKIDGKTAILLSAPTSGRTCGKIFVGLVNEDGSISWKYPYDVNNGSYAYSCLTELKSEDGTSPAIGLLYENDTGSITYTSLSISAIAPDATVEKYVSVTDNSTGLTITAPRLNKVVVGESTQKLFDKNTRTASITYSIQLYDADGKLYTGPADIELPYAKVEDLFADCDAFSGSVSDEKGTDSFSVQLVGNVLKAHVPHFSDVTFEGRSTDFVTTKTEDITLYVGQSQTITDNTGYYKDWETNEEPDGSVASMTVDGTAGTEASTTYPEASSVTCGDLIDSPASNWTKTGYYYKVGDTCYPLYAKGNGRSLGKKTYTWGYSTSDSSNNVTDIGTQKAHTSDEPNFTVYTKSGKDGTPGYTTITFTGVAAEKTTAIVGYTLYNITVKELPPYVTSDNTPFVVGSGLTGAGEILTKLTLSVGLSYDIDLSSTVTGDVTWTVADSSIATVDQSGKVTGVEAGETTVTATINGVAYQIPVVIVKNTTSYSTKLCSLHIAEILDTNVWYSWNCSGSTDRFIKAVEGEAIYVTYASSANYCVNFYGAPYTDYALTFMSATNSQGQYLSLQNKSDPTQCDFYTQDGAGKNERNNSAFGDAKVAADIQAALNLGCDGAQGFSRGSGETRTVDCDLSFRSRKLPTVTKEIKSVGGTAYTEGMTAKVGDVIEYTITVTQYATGEAITYTDPTLTDTLSGAVFTDNSSTMHSVDLSNNTLSTDQTYTYTVRYTIKDSDLDTNIVNNVSLSYSYSSTYSSGTFTGSASARAEISAPLFAPKDIVIDFGLPVVIDYSGAEKRYGLKDGSGKEVGNYATYGTVSVSGNVVTYTPNTVLMGVDTVYLTNTAGGVYTFKVYPATTVYYEEGFMHDGKGTSIGSKGTVAQTTEFVGAKQNVYGFDPAYVGTNMSHTSSVIGTAEFTFTGTGVDIYADCTPNSGTVLIQVYDGRSLKKMLTVNTAMVKGKTDVTSGEKQAKSANNVPIASIEGLSATPKEYDVVITHVSGTGTVALDGFRVHGTLSLDTEAYQKDGESKILLQELRDAVLKIQLGATAGSSDLTVRQDIKLYQEQMKAMTSNGEPNTQVYKGFIISEVTSASQDKAVLNDLLDNGPKNEVYLAENETLVFTVNTTRNVQVGVKVLSGTGTCGINRSNKTVSETDMFYTVTPNDDGTVTIKNTGSGTLAITELKFTDPKPTT